MSARPLHTAAALLAALCLLMLPSPAEAGVRHHRVHAGAKKAHKLMATFKRGRGSLSGRGRVKSPRPVTPSGTPAASGQATGAAGSEPRFGAFTDDAPYSGNVAGIERLQSRLQRKVDIVNWYQSWGGGDWTEAVHQDVIEAVTSSGRTPTLTWEPWDPAKGADQPAFRLRRIVEGDFDAYIASWADALRANGSEIYLRPMHEMNADWYPWGTGQGDNTPALFVKAWRHMHDIFTQHGANNVRWVWCPVPWSLPHTPANEIERFYPGAGYVDVLGLDGYNWGSARPDFGGWQSFSQVFKDAYDRLASLGPQPIWINEVGSAPEGGNKAAWVRDMWATARTWPRLKAIVWFDQNKEQDWRAEPVAAAFAQAGFGR